jgi:hypothetical protein
LNGENQTVADESALVNPRLPAEFPIRQTRARRATMHAIHARFWDIAYAVILAIALPVAIFHAAQDRWAQAILVTLAAGVGALILVTGWNRAEPVAAPVEGDARDRRPQTPVQPGKIEVDQGREGSGRYNGWIPMGAVSGFVATGIMTAAVLLSYGLSAMLASQDAGANQLQVWSANLINNTVTEMATVNMAVAIAIHLVAGIGWAIVYAGFAEPRLSGTGFQRGVKFGLLPWVLSVVIFFPLVGAGFFAADIGAGPLPVLGNLILHLIYGAALGKIYTSNAIWTEPASDVSPHNLEVMAVVQRAMAIGLVPGAVLGLIVAIVASSAFTPDNDLVMAGVLGAVVGSAVGIWIGSLAGLSSGPDDASDRASA